jgi:hypothetical protein
MASVAKQSIFANKGFSGDDGLSRLLRKARDDEVGR